MINLELYRIFYIVAQEKNVTSASKKLNISQPAVTKHIKNLEDQLGTPLFIRTKKGVLLNEYGERIFLRVKQALDLLSDVEYDITNTINTYCGTIKLGISTSLAKLYLEAYLESFHKEYPNILFDIYTDPTKDLIKKLKEGQIDLIISKIPSDLDLDLNYDIIGKSNYCFCYSPKYFKFTDNINIKELVNYPILLQKEPSSNRLSIEKYLKMNNINIVPKMNIASSNLLISFIKSGYGIGYVTKMYIENELNNKELKIIKVEPELPSVNYGIITLKNSSLTKTTDLFVRHIKS